MNMRCVALAVLGLCAGGALQAQTTQPPVQVDARFSWVLPTMDTLGQPLSGTNALTKVKAFIRTTSIPDTDANATPTAELPGTATSFTYTTSVPNGSTIYGRFEACNANCSALSAQASKAIAVSIPNVPTGVSVTVTVTVTTQ